MFEIQGATTVPCEAGRGKLLDDSRNYWVLWEIHNHGNDFVSNTWDIELVAGLYSLNCDRTLNWTDFG
jgi:hypothetical protein